MTASTRQANLFAAEDWKKFTRLLEKQIFKVMITKQFVKVWWIIFAHTILKILMILNPVNI